MTVSRTLRVGVIGFGWMGRLHARSWARLSAHYPGLPLRPALVAVGDSNQSEELSRSVEAHGFAELHADWRDLLARDDLDVVSVCGPNHLHRDMAVAVVESGRHLWIEKPAGRNAEETAEIATAVEKAGVQSAAGFNYRNAPAIEYARQGCATGAWAGCRPSRSASWPTTPPIRKVRCRGGSSTSRLAAGYRETWQATPWTSRTTSPATWSRSSPTTGASSQTGPCQQVAAHTSPVASRALSVRSRTRTTWARCCASQAGLEAPWWPVGQRLASSAATGSRSTVTVARSPGTSAGWASCGCR